MRRLFIIWFCIIAIACTSFGQSPYEFRWKKELPYLATGIGTLGAGYYLSTLPPVLTVDELMTLNPKDINWLDRFAAGKYSASADQFSDVFFLGSHMLPFLFLANNRSRSKFGQIISLYGEAATINLGLTLMTKSLLQRPRPFVFSSDAPDDWKFHRKAKTSFFSGHVSMTAVNTFFAAKVFSDFYPESKWKPFVWGAAVTLPAITAYLRIAAGKHYPTDVITGYAVGAAVGILVPQWHRNKNLTDKGLKFDVGYNSAKITWKFKGEKLR